MENIDNRILPQDDHGSLNNLGKKRKSNFSTPEDASNPKDSSFGIPPDEFLMLKDEGKIDTHGVLLTDEEMRDSKNIEEETPVDDEPEKSAEDTNPEDSGTETMVAGPVLLGGGRGNKTNTTLSRKRTFSPRIYESHKPKPIKPNRKTIRKNENLEIDR